MAYGHRKPALVTGECPEGSLLPPDPMSPFGEVKINFAGVQVRVPFTGIEPTASQLIKLAIGELRNFGEDPPAYAVLAPSGAEQDLEFDLVVP